MDPKIIGVGPAPATRRAMLKIEDIDLVEASEAVAAQSIGHPMGASGAHHRPTRFRNGLRPRRACLPCA